MAMIRSIYADTISSTKALKIERTSGRILLQLLPQRRPPAGPPAPLARASALHLRHSGVSSKVCRPAEPSPPSRSPPWQQFPAHPPSCCRLRSAPPARRLLQPPCPPPAPPPCQPSPAAMPPIRPLLRHTRLQSRTHDASPTQVPDFHDHRPLLHVTPTLLCRACREALRRRHGAIRSGRLAPCVPTTTSPQPSALGETQRPRRATTRCSATSGRTAARSAGLFPKRLQRAILDQPALGCRRCPC